MSVKEDLGDTRPYWKVLVSLVFSLTATVIKDYETIGLGNYHYSGTCVVHRSDLSDYQPDMGRNFGIDPQFSKHVS